MKKRAVSFVLAFVLLLGLAVSVSATDEVASMGISTSEQRLYDIVDAINNRDWDAYASYGSDRS